MGDSALEHAAIHVARLFGRWARSHDRFVVIGLLFSLLPVPPACFAAWVISLINTWLLRTGALPASERRAVRVALLLSSVNSVIAAWGMVWLSTHLHEFPQLGPMTILPDGALQFFDALIDRITGATPRHDPNST